MDHTGGNGGSTTASPLSLHIQAFGRRGYIHAAINLAWSIRAHDTTSHIILLADERSLEAMRPQYLDAFSEVRTLAQEDYCLDGIIDPGWSKVTFHRRAAQGGILIDADTLCLRDPRPWVAALSADPRALVTDVIDAGDGDVEYTPWVSAQRQRELLGPKCTIYGLNTSWMMVRPSELHRRIEHHFTNTFTTGDLDRQWGGTMPDELAIAYACSEAGHDPSWPRDVMFFGNHSTLPTIEAIAERYTFMAFYGPLRGHTLLRRRYIEMYDSYMRRVMRTFDLGHIYKLNTIAADKHVQLRPAPAPPQIKRHGTTAH